MPRKPATRRKDGNHDEIVAIAESYGWQVVSLSSAGSGIPDLLCWRHPQGFLLIEVKNGKGRLKPAQRRFRERYTMPVLYIHTEHDAYVVFGMGEFRSPPPRAAE